MQRLESKENPEFKGQRPHLISVDEIRCFVHQVDCVHREDRYGEILQLPQRVMDRYFLNLRSFFATLPETKQNRELTAQEIFHLKSFLFAPRNKYRNDIESLIVQLQQRHEKEFQAIDLMAMMPNPKFSQTLLTTILERFSQFEKIHALFHRLYNLDLLTDENALAGIRYIYHFEIYDKFFRWFTVCMKDRINLFLLFQFAPQVEACINHYCIGMFGSDGEKHAVHSILLHLEYLTEIKKSLDFYYGIADNNWERFNFIFISPNHMQNVIKVLCSIDNRKFGARTQWHDKLDFHLIQLLFDNVEHINTLGKARKILLDGWEDKRCQLESKENGVDAEKSILIREVERNININDLYFQFFAKNFPKHADSLAMISICLTEYNCWTPSTMKEIFENINLCNDVSRALSAIRSYGSIDCLSLVLDNMKHAGQLSNILFYYRHEELNKQSSVDLVKHLFNYKSIWPHLIKQLAKSNHLKKEKGHHAFNEKDILKMLDDISFKCVFLNGLHPRKGHNSLVFNFFGKKGKGAPNHPLGDAQPLRIIKKFIS